METSVKDLCESFSYYIERFEYLIKKVDVFLNAYNDMEKIPQKDYGDWICLLKKIKPYLHNIKPAPKARYLINNIVTHIFNLMIQKKDYNKEFILYSVYNTLIGTEQILINKLIKYFIAYKVAPKDEFEKIIEAIIQMKGTKILQEALRNIFFNPPIKNFKKNILKHKYFFILYNYLPDDIKRNYLSENKIKKVEELERMKRIAGIS